MSHIQRVMLRVFTFNWASDFSGTINFVVNVNDYELGFAERDLVEIEYSFQLGNRKVGSDYLEIVNNRRLLSINKK